MELIASLFCHVSESIPEAEIQQELQRQHDILAQNAASSGRTIEHCFFHVGEFNLEDPDQVLLRFLQRAQADDLGLVLVESKDLFPCRSKHIYHAWRCALYGRVCKKSLEIKMSKWLKKTSGQRMYICTGAFS